VRRPELPVGEMNAKRVQRVRWDMGGLSPGVVVRLRAHVSPFDDEEYKMGALPCTCSRLCTWCWRARRGGGGARGLTQREVLAVATATGVPGDRTTVSSFQRRVDGRQRVQRGPGGLPCAAAESIRAHVAGAREEWRKQ